MRRVDTASGGGKNSSVIRWGGIADCVLLAMRHGYILKRRRFRGQVRKCTVACPSRKRPRKRFGERTSKGASKRSSKRSKLIKMVAMIRQEAQMIEGAVKWVSLGSEWVFKDHPLIITFTMTFGLETVVASRSALVTLDASFSTCYSNKVSRGHRGG